MYRRKKQFGRGNDEDDNPLVATETKECNKYWRESKCKKEGCCYSSVDCFDCNKLKSGDTGLNKKSGHTVLENIRQKVQRGQKINLREELELKHDALQDKIKFGTDLTSKGVSYDEFIKKLQSQKQKDITSLSKTEKKNLVLNLLKLLWEGTTKDKQNLAPTPVQIETLYNHMENEFNYNFNIDPRNWVKFIWENDDDWLFWKDRTEPKPWITQKEDILRRAKALCREVVLSGRKLCTFDGHGRFIYAFYKCFYFCTNLFDTTIDPETGYEVLPEFNPNFYGRDQAKIPHIKVYTLEESEYIWHTWFFPDTVRNIELNVFYELWDNKNDQLNCKKIDKYVVYLNFCGMGPSYIHMTKLLSVFKDYNTIRKRERIHKKTGIRLCEGEPDMNKEERKVYKNILSDMYKYKCGVHEPIIYLSYMTGSQEWKPKIGDEANNIFRTCVSLPLLEDCEMVSFRDEFYTRKIVGSSKNLADKETSESESSKQYKRTKFGK